MSRITTKDGLANLTASLLKVDGVTSIDPPDSRSKFAKAANRWYDISRRETLADHVWNFAEKTIFSASKENSEELRGRFANRYVLPADYIRLVWLGDELVPETDYKIKEGFIYCNLPSPIMYGYIFDIEDVVLYSPKFIGALARRLAANCGYEVSGSRTLQKELEMAYVQYLSDGSAIDAQESPPTHRIRRSRWRRAKEGRGMLGGDYSGRVVT